MGISPRLSVSLDEQQYNTLTRLATLQGRSVGAILRELVDAIEPSLERTVLLGEAYLDSWSHARDSLSEADGVALELELQAAETALEGIRQRLLDVRASRDPA